MNLTSLDIAVLLEKSIILNGLIAFGSKIEKQKAKKEMEQILPIIREVALSGHGNSKMADYPFL
ncbi:TPA: hypothetical protein NJY08_004772 [Salmonella enterica subsp. enterica serovar Typhi str. AG3]|nr:hypothetical protein [Salmonella enterica subsp. enterica serovar Typhi str. AG3]